MAQADHPNAESNPCFRAATNILFLSPKSLRVRKEINDQFGRGDFGPGQGAKSEHTRRYVSDEQRSHGAKAPGQIESVISLRTLNLVVAHGQRPQLLTAMDAAYGAAPLSSNVGQLTFPNGVFIIYV